jgi:hypothetical protein
MDCKRLLNSLENLLSVANSQGHQEAQKFFKKHSEEFQNKIPCLGMNFKYYDSFNDRIVIDLFRDHAFKTEQAVKRCACLKERGENVEYLGIFHDGAENEDFYELMYNKTNQVLMKLIHPPLRNIDPSKGQSILRPDFNMIFLNKEKSIHSEFDRTDDPGILEAKARREILHYHNSSDRFRTKLTWMMSYIQSARIDDIGTSYRVAYEPLKWVDELNKI